MKTGISNNVLFVKDWLKFGEKDEEGFLYHMHTLSESKIKISMYTMKKISESYHVDDGHMLAITYNRYFRDL